MFAAMVVCELRLCDEVEEGRSNLREAMREELK